MELDQLRIFARVAELGSFTQAADQLGMAKGRVSQVVQRLEAQVGARLLQRTTRRVRLTPDGEQFLERGQELIADADQLQAMLTQIVSPPISGHSMQRSTAPIDGFLRHRPSE